MRMKSLALTLAMIGMLFPGGGPPRRGTRSTA